MKKCILILLSTISTDNIAIDRTLLMAPIIFCSIGLVNFFVSEKIATYTCKKLMKKAQCMLQDAKTYCHDYDAIVQGLVSRPGDNNNDSYS